MPACGLCPAPVRAVRCVRIVGSAAPGVHERAPAEARGNCREQPRGEPGGEGGERRHQAALAGALRATSANPSAPGGDQSSPASVARRQTVRRCSAAIAPRATQFDTAEGCTPQASATFVDPPRREINSAMESIDDSYSRNVSLSKPILTWRAIACLREQIAPMNQPTRTQMQKEMGWRLRLARDRARLSQESLGELMGVGATTVQGYETGRNQIDVAALARVVRHLGVSTDYVILGDYGGVRHDVALELQALQKKYAESPPPRRGPKPRPAAIAGAASAGPAGFPIRGPDLTDQASATVMGAGGG